ncbi:hypothetical protein GUJ93_ZPchr0012g20350 [Zizania palustris]|uniref:Uncharacterized protein n=1 Tax=Zizania palustris TaxID=103762 RepID=A0A8J5WTC4_ZIZPA|nr:hypothetical protein GUJ93_ZPchr0012g20350 [Zizania palustris]
MPRQLAVVKTREPTGASKLTVVRAGEREEARERQLTTTAGGREGAIEVDGELSASAKMPSQAETIPSQMPS